MNALLWVVVGIAGYAAGSFPSGVIIGRLVRGVDLRSQGSGNPGTTNALRVLGPLPGIIVFVLDFGKGLAAATLPGRLLGSDLGWLGGLTAVIGHILPIFAGFRGGKGLATACGVIAYLQPWFLAVFVPVWAVVFLACRKSAPASAAAILCVALVALVFTMLGRMTVWPMAVTVLGALVIFARHWPEARRVLGW
ncbi:MAG: glycerol-3-phosphate acyltransferase [Bacteroidota bacterium]